MHRALENLAAWELFERGERNRIAKAIPEEDALYDDIDEEDSMVVDE